MKEYESEYADKDKEVAGLWEKLEQASQYITEANNKFTNAQEVQMQERNKFIQ